MEFSMSNPMVEEIRRNVQSSYMELNRVIEDQLAHIDAAKLYEVPAQGEWTIMENLAHIAEFMTYWADEIAKLLAKPGQSFGRTMQHEGRLSAIREHAHDSLEQASAALAGSYAHLQAVLGMLKDSDLGLTGVHPKYGEQSLAWFINEFVTKHLADHVEQLRTSLEAVQAN
jgi:hypothetical protein